MYNSYENLTLTFYFKEHFLRVPLVDKSKKESTKMKLICFEKLIKANEGRKDIQNSVWQKIEPFFGSFCTNKENEAVNKYRNVSNLTTEVTNNNYRKLYEEIGGTTMSQTLSAAKYAFILTIVSNYLVKVNNSVLEWNPSDVSVMKYTNPKEKGSNVGWSQAELDYYTNHFMQESKYRKILAKNFF